MRVVVTYRTMMSGKVRTREKSGVSLEDGGYEAGLLWDKVCDETPGAVLTEWRVDNPGGYIGYDECGDGIYSRVFFNAPDERDRQRG